MTLITHERDTIRQNQHRGHPLNHPSFHTMHQVQNTWELKNLTFLKPSTLQLYGWATDLCRLPNKILKQVFICLYILIELFKIARVIPRIHELWIRIEWCAWCFEALWWSMDTPAKKLVSNHTPYLRDFCSHRFCCRCILNSVIPLTPSIALWFYLTSYTIIVNKLDLKKLLHQHNSIYIFPTSQRIF